MTFERTRHHPSGFSFRMFIHFPYDTLAQLWRYRPEVLVSSEFGLRTLQAVIYRAMHPRARLIVWATLSEETEKGWGLARRLLRRAILKMTDAVICNGNSGARYVRSMGFPASQTFIVNQPVDVDMFSALPADRGPENAHRLLFSGRLIPAKAVVQLQETLSRWARANPTRQLEIAWVGDGELRGRLEQASLPANFKQVFHGNKAYAELPDAYRDCGALILPSLMDEWGLVVNEAMASGLVVMGSIYSQAAIEMVEEGKNGWLIDPLNPASIEAALDALYDASPDVLREMRVAARERALKITPRRAAARLYSAIKVVRHDPSEVKAKRLAAVGEASASACRVRSLDVVQ